MNSERVRWAYRLLLAREPENESVLETYAASSPEDLVRAFLASDEFRKRGLTDSQTLPSQIFKGYTEADVSIIREFARPQKPTPGFVTDFMGTKTRVTFSSIKHLDGAVLGPPIPSDFHAEAIEWIGLLKSVKSAADKFRLLELGAGWGPWMAAGHQAAKLRGISDIAVYGAEADPDHAGFMRANMADNSIQDAVLLDGFIGTERGSVKWPVSRDAAADYGQGLMSEAEIIHHGNRFTHTVPVDVIPIIPVLEREPTWDCIHIDIQGAESAICEHAIAKLTELARWVIIGTHSRPIEGKLIDLFAAHGWHLENEKPCQFHYDQTKPSLLSMVGIDGTQVWRNVRKLT